MSEEEPVRRLSICRQLSDVLKSTRKSPLSTSKFSWNCTLNKMDSPTEENSKILSNGSIVTGCLVKQKSISCDDLVFLSSELTICTNTKDTKSNENGLLFLNEMKN
jgi:hypothetical protein